MNMVATFELDHAKLSEIIQTAVAKTGATVDNVDLWGVRGEGNVSLTLGATVQLRTKQGDSATSTVDHSKICNWVNAALGERGYDLGCFNDALITGTIDPERENNVHTQIKWLCHYDVEMAANRST
jgi:hypothetical protein